MNLFGEIVEKRNETRKSGDAQACKLYQLILGEIETKAKRDNVEPNDEFVLSVMKKMIKSNEDSLKIRYNEQLVFENSVLKEYLPKVVEVSTAELADIILDTDARNIKDVLQVLDAKYGSAGYDKKGVVATLKKVYSL